MKKALIALTAAAAIVSAAFCIHRQVALCNDPLFANVEALTDHESTSGEVCYNSITTAEGMQILYCGECKWIRGKKSIWSGKGICQ